LKGKRDAQFLVQFVEVEFLLVQFVEFQSVGFRSVVVVLVEFVVGRKGGSQAQRSAPFQSVVEFSFLVEFPIFLFQFVEFQLIVLRSVVVVLVEFLVRREGETNDLAPHVPPRLIRRPGSHSVRDDFVRAGSLLRRSPWGGR
jgi:hypothetical protein